MSPGSTRNTKRFGIVLAVVAFLFLTVSAPRTAEAEWNYDLAVYLFALGLDGEMTVMGQTAEVDVGFSDILEDLQFAFSTHFEARKQDANWGILFDVYLAQLGSDLDMPKGQYDMDMTFLEVGGTYQTGSEFDLLYGIRYITMDALLRVDAPFPPPFQPSGQVGGDQDWADFFVGGRLKKRMGERWTLIPRLDLAGFGLTDGSDLTWNLQLLAQVQTTEKFSLLLGYRYMDIDYENTKDLFAMDVTLAGPVVAANWHW